MRFILSALLATTLLAAMASADVHHQGQQAAFRLEPRHNHASHSNRHHHNKVDQSHHRKSTSKKQRRDEMMNEPYAMVQVSTDDKTLIRRGSVKQQATVNLHREDKANHSHHRKSSYHRHNKVDHNHHRQSKRALALHRKRANHSHHHSSTCKHEKRALALHRKKSQHHRNKVDHSHHHKSSSSSHKVQKRGAPADKNTNNKKVNADGELAFHRKISRNRKSHRLGQNKHEKRAARATKKTNTDEELAFHRKISRNRKTHKLGEKKNEKRDMFSQEQDGEYTVVRAEQEPVFKTQDIKNFQSHKKNHKVSSSSRKNKKAQRKQKNDQ